MPGIICQEVKSSPIIKPYIVKETPSSTVKFRSPIRTRTSVPSSSLGSVRSIGQRIEKQRYAKSEARPSSRGSKLQKQYLMDTGSSTPVRVHKTSVKAGRIEKKITPSKLPNFKTIHMREFSKMESIVEHAHRKAERIKTLMTPIKVSSIPIKNSNGPSLIRSKIPVQSDLNSKVSQNKTASTMPVKPQMQNLNRGKNSMSYNPKINVNLRKNQVSNVKDKLNLLDSPITKLRRKSGENITNIKVDPKKRIENVKKIVSTKAPPFSVERNRAKERDILKTVRMNKRFHLQMEVMRKAKA